MEPETAKYTKELEKLLTGSDNILLISHINPDGDAIGSQLAFYHYLKSRGRTAEMITPNNLQEFLLWMEGAELINVFIKNRQRCIELIRNSDLIIMLDFNQTNRLGEAEKYVMESKARKVVIDHHLNPDHFADLLISDPSVCSTSELLYVLIRKMNNGPFNSRPFAEALYIGIITDTGNFDHGNYTGDTLRITAELLDTGIDKDKIQNLIYNNFSADRMRLMGYSLNEKMVILPEFSTAYISLSKSDLERYNYVKGDTEGFVNLPLSISGIVFSVLFIEKDGFVKLSFRSKGSFPSNKFARKFFYGGGHLNASGGEYPDTLEKTITYFIKVLVENFRDLEKGGEE
ncbi:MAG: bifunctional oligoribonuclease/PAP phosphatase NrnA [Bacteroidales bacterium]|jgi:phosphoesterase RecJ-like protein|nr:bifunctional oligoribonuclease/PAP phosphatase NrnA [Bacteroidales bacterium]